MITNFTYMVPWWDFNALRLLNRRLIVVSFKVTSQFATMRFVASLKATMVALGFATRRFATNLKAPTTLPRFVTSLKAPTWIGICNKLESNNMICNKLESNKLEGSDNCLLEFFFIGGHLLVFLKLNICHWSNLFERWNSSENEGGNDNKLKKEIGNNIDS